ncbi:MAG: putative transporter ATP-binding protein YxlF [Planctomycetota bacterium]|jgi:ABC-2 type transport system ATP-binding protein
MESALSIRQLHVTFRTGLLRREVAALRGIDLEVAPGEIAGVLGPNGSGKTSLLRVLAGLQAPTRGSVQVLGRSPTDPALVQWVGFQPEAPPPMPFLTGRESLLHTGWLLRMPAGEIPTRADALLEQLGLADARHRQVRTWSTGMQKRLGLAVALMPRPRVLLLDEPTSGLDPLGSRAIVEMLRSEAAAGTTVLLASHHLQEVEALCQRVAVLHQGTLAASGTLDQLLGRGDLELVLRGLDEDGLRRLQEWCNSLGAQVVSSSRAREHLFELFRRVAEQGVQRQGDGRAP